MKRRGMALGLAALMTCTALFTTTANAKNKGSDEKETIKFTYWGSGDEKKAIEESVDKFMEANPNIEVDLMHIPSEDFLTKLNAMIAAGEAPDVSYSASWKCQMGEDGLILTSMIFWMIWDLVKMIICLPVGGTGVLQNQQDLFRPMLQQT